MAANADPTQIRLKFQGTKAHANQDGGLVLPTANGSELRFDKPVAYQQIDGKRVPVAAEFQIADGRVGFKLGSTITAATWSSIPRLFTPECWVPACNRPT